VDYKGEDTAVVIGDNNRIREYVTIHRGTDAGRGETRLGSDNFIMVGCHLAHDCLVGDRIIMANLATLAGHVEVGDDAVFGGFVGVHQRCRVGRVVMVAAMTKVVKDVPPYTLVGGDPPKFVGLNRVGLNRVGMGEDSKKALRKAYRMIFAKGVKLEQGLEKAESEFSGVAEVAYLLDFIRGSSRGIIRG
jgi:UDP-N-acetylglucosamine acyltransferase